MKITRDELLINILGCLCPQTLGKLIVLKNNKQ